MNEARSQPKLSRLKSREQVLVFGILSAFAVLGAVITDDFGVSWDEPADSLHGQISLEAYTASPNFRTTNPAGPTGPSYFMLTELFAPFLKRLSNAWTLADARHYLYFLTFLIGASFLYGLCRRLVRPLAAGTATALYLGQPLLLGHSFINPKDTPFLSIFLLSVLLGMKLADQSNAQRRNKLQSSLERDRGNLRGAIARLYDDWRALDRLRKVFLIATGLGGIALLLDLLVLHEIILPSLLKTTKSAYEGQSLALLNQLFDRVAEFRPSLPVGDYLWKTTAVYWQYRAMVATAALLPFGILVYRWLSESYRALLADARIRLLLAAAMSLGFLTAFRVIGIYAGLLVSLYFLLHSRGRSYWYLVFYWLVSSLFFILLRPYFWVDTFQRLQTGFTSVVGFQWKGRVLYQGELYSVSELPAGYSPLIILSQLTLPILTLSILGLIFIVSDYLRGRSKVDTSHLAILGVWILFPFLGGFLELITRYDNFRQLLFALPPLFVIGSVGIDRIVRALPNLGRAILIVVVLTPGLLSSIELHPYEYIYYNEARGGTGSAFRMYELDYWCISVREAAEALSELAPSGSTVAINAPFELATPFLRDDLTLHTTIGNPDVYAQFALVCGRGNSDLAAFPEGELIWSTERQDATLSVLKKILIDE